MERYGVSFRIQSEYGKIRNRKTPNMDTFYAVKPNKNSMIIWKNQRELISKKMWRYGDIQMVTKCHIIFLTLKFFCQKILASLYQFSLQPIMLCVLSGIYFVLFRPKPIVAYWVCKNKSVKKKNIYLKNFVQWKFLSCWM